MREVRRARGLSQTDIAGDGMSPSYISLVESGHRTPSPKVVRAIAERLGIPLDELSSPETPREQQRTHRLELVGRLVAARSYQRAGDHGAARDVLLDVIRQASGSGMEEALWEARWELAATHGRLGDEAAREETLRLLLADPLTGAAPQLRARVAVETADLLRGSGKLSESVRLSEEALRALPAAEAGAPERLQAQVSLLSGWLESGEWQRGEELCDDVVRSADALPAGQLRATALWAAAEYHYVAGRPEPALGLLERALELTGPEADAKVRVRMLWAAALLHLAADRPDTAGALVERFGRAVEVLGTPADATRLAMLRTLAELRHDAERALERAREAERGRAELPPVDRARCTVALARAYRAAGRAEEAEAEYKAAAALCEAAGAYRFAAAVWRELSVPGAPAGTADHCAVVTP